MFLSLNADEVNIAKCSWSGCVSGHRVGRLTSRWLLAFYGEVYYYDALNLLSMLEGFMVFLVTGAAGFIGSALCGSLLQSGNKVIGIDNLNPYYSVDLKKARLKHFCSNPDFTFYKLDIKDKACVDFLLEREPQIECVVHLAAQAGVRYSLEDPHTYIDANVMGHLNILELCRHHTACKHLLYASSSSVYGGNSKLPFSIKDRVDNPVSLYAATKKSCELMTHSYSSLYGICATGLRFFTVYGPWGRPDMAAFIFTKAILNDEEIPVFNGGNMRRNFTYIDDIVEGVQACIEKSPVIQSGSNSNCPRHTIFNLGNNRSESLIEFIREIESATGRTAKIKYLPMQPGDVKETVADISETMVVLGFAPKTNVSDGIPQFVNWYKNFYQVREK